MDDPLLPGEAQPNDDEVGPGFTDGPPERIALGWLDPEPYGGK